MPVFARVCKYLKCILFLNGPVDGNGSIVLCLSFAILLGEYCHDGV